MGVCHSEKKQNIFLVDCSAKIKELYDYYERVVDYLRATNFFASSSPELSSAIDQYLENPCEFDPCDLRMAAIDSVNKLHPFQYDTSVVTKQYLQSCCLRHHTFISQFPFQLLSFDTCYNLYVQYLYYCHLNPEVTIMPSKMVLFIWHSHMQDHEAYKRDMRKILGRVLDHKDDFSSEEEEQYRSKTIQLRKKHYSNSTRCVLEGHYNGQELQKKKSQEEFSRLLRDQEEKRSRGNSGIRSQNSQLAYRVTSRFSNKENINSKEQNCLQLRKHQTCS